MKKLIIVLLLAVIALKVLNIVDNPRLKADVVYPMVNQRITWDYAGK